MPQITGSLSEGKPIISVAVFEGAPIATAVEPVPEPPQLHLKEYKALLDTGADITCVMPHVIRECFLIPRGLINMTSGSGSYEHMSYLINLGIWHEEVVDIGENYETQRGLYNLDGPYIAAEIRHNSWFDLIIGMDIIAQHELAFVKGNQFRLTLS